MDPVTNFGTGTVLTAPSPTTSGTTLVLQSGEGDNFPTLSAGEGFELVIAPASVAPLKTNSEIVRVTARSGDTLTITRAQEGTTARDVQVGDKVYLTPTKKFRDDIQTHIDNLSNPHDVTASQLVDFDDEVTESAAVAANTAHRGQTTGNPHSVTKSDVGLGNVTNDAQIPLTQKGAASGVAELDSGGKVPTAQLPSFVDDVLEYADQASLPVTGETGKIYVALDTNKTYRWSGSAYVEISQGLALGETSATAYRGDRGKTAYDHSQVTSGNPHNVTASDIGVEAGADVTDAVNIASSLNGAAAKTTPATTDVFGLLDSAASFALKKITFSNLRTTIASYYNSLTATLTNKTINADNNTISNLEVDNLKSGVLDTDLSTVSANDDTLASAKAIKTAIDAAAAGSNSFHIDQSGGTSDTFGALSGTINGTTTLFTVSAGEYISGSLIVWLNGQLLTQGSSEDWVETTPASGTFTFSTAPQSGDQITVAYQSVTSTSGNADTVDGLHAVSLAKQSEWSDGWLDAGETWTYASATSFTVSGDVTSKYTGGVRIKWNEGATTKYGIVLSSSYTAPNTTVNLVENEVYSIANTTLSSECYSHTFIPSGYPRLFVPTTLSVYSSSCHTGTAQTVGTTSFTAVQLNNEVSDVHGDFNASTYTFTCPITGLYAIEGCVQVSDMTADKRVIARIYMNGNTSLAQKSIHASYVRDIQALVSKTVYLTSGDTIQLEVFQDSGGNKSLDTGEDTTYMTITLLQV